MSTDTELRAAIAAEMDRAGSESMRDNIDDEGVWHADTYNADVINAVLAMEWAGVPLERLITIGTEAEKIREAARVLADKIEGAHDSVPHDQEGCETCWALDVIDGAA